MSLIKIHHDLKPATSYTIIGCALASLALYSPINQAQPLSAEETQQIKAEAGPPPAGFEWKIYKDAYFLKPQGWNEDEKFRLVGNVFPLYTYVTSPQKFEYGKKPFDTGMTLEIVSFTKNKIKNLNTEETAKAMTIGPIIASHKKEDILSLSEKTNGPFKQVVFRYRDAPAGMAPIIVHKFIVINSGNDSVNTFTFESPEQSWDSNWEKYGKSIFKHIAVFPNISPIEKP